MNIQLKIRLKLFVEDIYLYFIHLDQLYVIAYTALLCNLKAASFLTA